MNFLKKTTEKGENHWNSIDFYGQDDERVKRGSPRENLRGQSQGTVLRVVKGLFEGSKDNKALYFSIQHIVPK